MSTVLGVYPGGHDPGAAIVRDGSLVVMIEDERLTRVKHGALGAYQTSGGLWAHFHQRWGFFPWASVTYCLKAAGIRWDDLDAIVVPGFGKQDCQIVPPVGEDPLGGFDWGAFLPIDRKKIIVADQPCGGSHHLMHAFSTFFASPFDRAAVMVIDAAGSVTDEGHEAETGYVIERREGAVREIFKNRYPMLSVPGARPVETSMGFMYEHASGVLGFANTRAMIADAGKTMGLAPYGGANPDFEEEWVGKDGFKLDFSNVYRFAFETGLHKLFSFTDTSRALILNELRINQYAKDFAFKVQKELEQAVVHLAIELRRATGATDLCLAGGVALNSVANGILLQKGIFERIYAQPAAADSGQSIGLAYYGHLQLDRTVPIRPMRHAFGGATYPRDEIGALLDASGLTFEELPDDAALAGDAADALSHASIIGWFQGGSECGPRALGHRSILADPRGAEMKDRLNARVKFRESFRPFAPSVLGERSSEIFELEAESPYMLLVAPVRAAWRERVPAITHVDGTARIQTVDREVDPLFHGLISAFAARTGVPLVLNTSFNLRGMPIVETPRDALQCFLFTDMDVLYLGRFKVKPSRPEQMFPRVGRDWTLHATRAYARDATAPEVVNAFEKLGESERRVEAPSFPWLEAFVTALDGKRSVAQALAHALARGPSADELADAGELVRSMLRARVMTLRVGSVWL